MKIKTRKLVVKFETAADLSEFNNLIGISCPKNTKILNLPSGDIKLKSNVRIQRKPAPPWKSEWVGMHDFVQEEIKFHASFDVLLDVTKDDSHIKEFSKLLNQNITHLTKSIYYPYKVPGQNSALRVTSTRGNPKYPMYVVSKTRADNCKTAIFLRKMGVPFYIVIEEHQYQDYAEYFDEKHLLILKQEFLDDYVTYDDFGSTKSKGPGAARNFAWDHSIQNGHKWHWVFDDNIFGFFYLNDNVRMKSADGGIFASAEDFVDRYDNLAVTGLNYFMFAIPGSKYPPYILNTRVYSMLLIRNDIPFRWQGRYNEDTDLSLRVLKAGWSTLQFNAFLGDKLCTQVMRGGNSEEFYDKEGTGDKSQMLVEQHPDCSTLTYKFSRVHHQVDYSRWAKNPMNKDGSGASGYDTIDYKLKTVRLSEQDHKLHNESKKHVYVDYLKLDFNEDTDLALPDILTHKLPSEAKIQQGKDEKEARRLRDIKALADKVKNDGAYKTIAAISSNNTNRAIVISNPEFDDEEVFKLEMDKYKKINGLTQILTDTNGSIALFCANYGTKNKINTKDYKPNYIMHGEDALLTEHTKMAEDCSEAIIFEEKLTEDMRTLISLLELKNIPITYINLNNTSDSLEVW